MIIFQSLESSLFQAPVPQVLFSLEDCNVRDKTAIWVVKICYKERDYFYLNLRGNWTHLIVAKFATMANFKMVTALYVHIMSISTITVNKTKFSYLLKQHVSNNVTHLQAK
jgi:hypothetical protein